MGFGALRNIIRPLSRTLASRISTATPTPFPAAFSGSAAFKQLQCFPLSKHLHSLADTRYRKRRPSDKPRPKRASLRPPGLCPSHASDIFIFHVVAVISGGA